MKSEMLWYLIKDGESEDMGTETIFFGGGGENLQKRWVYISFRFRVAQNLELMTFWDTWTFKVLRNIHAPDDIRKVTF